jgi:hypothetical protein
MARQKPTMYANIRWTHERWGDFRRKIEGAGLRSLDVAGRGGAEVARVAWTRNRTGESRRRIGFFRSGRDGGIYVGTLQGSIQEFGTDKTRGGRGTIEPLRALYKGMAFTVNRTIQLMKAQLRV